MGLRTNLSSQGRWSPSAHALPPCVTPLASASVVWPWLRRRAGRRRRPKSGAWPPWPLRRRRWRQGTPNFWGILLGIRHIWHNMTHISTVFEGTKVHEGTSSWCEKLGVAQESECQPVHVKINMKRFQHRTVETHFKLALKWPFKRIHLIVDMAMQIFGGSDPVTIFWVALGGAGLVGLGRRNRTRSHGSDPYHSEFLFSLNISLLFWIGQVQVHHATLHFRSCSVFFSSLGYPILNSHPQPPFCHSRSASCGGKWPSICICIWLSASHRVVDFPSARNCLGLFYIWCFNIV